MRDCLDIYATVYVDDILIYSESLEEYEEHVKAVLERLRKAGLQIVLHKCEWEVTSTKFLGFIVSTEGVSPDPEKVAVITNWKGPQTVKSVQLFLGFCNFYRRFVEQYSRLAKPLFNLTRKEVQCQ